MSGLVAQCLRDELDYRHVRANVVTRNRGREIHVTPPKRSDPAGFTYNEQGWILAFAAELGCTDRRGRALDVDQLTPRGRLKDRFEFAVPARIRDFGPPPLGIVIYPEDLDAHFARFTPQAIAEARRTDPTTVGHSRAAMGAYLRSQQTLFPVERVPDSVVVRMVADTEPRWRWVDSGGRRYRTHEVRTWAAHMVQVETRAAAYDRIHEKWADGGSSGTADAAYS